MDNGSRLELHYYLRDGSHTIDALVRNRCEAEFLTAVAYIAESLGAKVRFEASIPEEGGFRDIWRVAFDKENRTMSVSALSTLLGILITQSVVIWNAPPRPNPELERQQLEINRLTAEHMRLENERSLLEIKKLQGETAKAETPVPPPSIPQMSGPAITPSRETGTSTVTPQASGERKAPALQMDPRLNKRRSNFYRQLVAYESVTAVGFRWRSEDRPLPDERIVSRGEFASFLLQSDTLPPEITEAVIEIVSPVITQGDMQWKGRWNGQTISFAMDDRNFKAEVIHKKVPFQHGDCIRCELEIERKIDEGGAPKVTGYRVRTVFEKIAGGVAEETPQGRRKRFETKHAGAQADMFEPEPRST